MTRDKVGRTLVISCISAAPKNPKKKYASECEHIVMYYVMYEYGNDQVALFSIHMRCSHAESNTYYEEQQKNGKGWGNSPIH